jgi:GNAT superfamily N-acetyltransferase
VTTVSTVHSGVGGATIDRVAPGRDEPTMSGMDDAGTASPTQDWHIERCQLERMLPLRSRISYDATGTPQQCVAPTDGADGAVHYVAVAGGCDIGAASLSPDPRRFDTTTARWRLSYLAVDERWRERGIGSALVLARLSAVAAFGERFAWCQARLHRAPMYERLGAVIVSGVTPDPERGLCVDMLYGPISGRAPDRGGSGVSGRGYRHVEPPQ